MITPDIQKTLDELRNQVSDFSARLAAKLLKS